MKHPFKLTPLVTSLVLMGLAGYNFEPYPRLSFFELGLSGVAMVAQCAYFLFESSSRRETK